jgi:tetratricopeptide (TPR) repeat protein
LNPKAYPLQMANLLAYRTGLRLVRESADRKLGQIGNRGLCDLVRTLLAIFSNDHHNRALRLPLNQAVEDIQSILGGIFREDPVELQAVNADPRNLYPQARSDDLILGGVSNDVHYISVGSLVWHQCVLRTSSSTLRYDGPNLFDTPAISSAFSFAIDGNFHRAREILREAIATATTSVGVDKLWLALAATYYDNGKYDRAIEIFELAITEQPALFRSHRKFWGSWYDVYKMKRDLGAAVERFGLSLARHEGDCWHELSRAYVEGFKDYEKAIAVLVSASKVSGRELTAWEWADIGKTYSTVVHKSGLAIEAYQRAIAMNTADSSFFWHQLSMEYDSWDDKQCWHAILNAIRTAATASEIWRDEQFLDNVSEMPYSAEFTDILIYELGKQLAHNPEEPAIRELLIEAYWVRGMGWIAVQMYKDGIKEGILETEDFKKWLEGKLLEYSEDVVTEWLERLDSEFDSDSGSELSG